MTKLTINHHWGSPDTWERIDYDKYGERGFKKTCLLCGVTKSTINYFPGKTTGEDVSITRWSHGFTRWNHGWLIRVGGNPPQCEKEEKDAR